MALLLENRPEHLLHKLALTGLGAWCVPVNPDYRSGEIAYLVDHSRADLACVRRQASRAAAGRLAEAVNQPPVVALEDFERGAPRPARRPDGGAVTAGHALEHPVHLGHHRRPKGCILSHHYEVASGHWYASRGALAAMRIGEERLYNALPAVSRELGGGVVLRDAGDRRLPGPGRPVPAAALVARGDPDPRQHRALLGVIVPMLLNQPPAPADRGHGVRFGIGGGCEPQLHAAFEERFGFP